jgi:hypothetical protein
VSTPASVARLLKAYVLGSAGALCVACVFASVGDWWEHQTGERALLLLPVSNVRFWFIPFAAVFCAIAARTAGRPTRPFVVSTGILSLACAWSVLLWYRVGRQLGPDWTPAEFASVMASADPERVAGGALSLTGIVFLLVGIVGSFRTRRPSASAGLQMDAG